MSLRNPPGWTPAKTPEEAIERMKKRWSQPPLDFDVVHEDVGERVAIMYEHLEEVPEYRILQLENQCRIFRRKGDKWRSAYVHTYEDVQRVIEIMEMDG
jgi:hypothetical protein